MHLLNAGARSSPFRGILSPSMWKVAHASTCPTAGTAWTCSLSGLGAGHQDSIDHTRSSQQPRLARGFSCLGFNSVMV